MSSSCEMIGLIGTGLMGTAMAARLISAGFRVLAWDRDAAALAACGAEAAEGAAAVMRRCARVLLSLPDSQVVSAVLDEVSGDLAEGSLVIDTSTGDPEDAVRIAARLRESGIGCVDANISGSSEQLRRGEALCMAGGEVEDFVRCADIFAAFGGPVMHVGGCGAGARMKLVTNLVLGLNRAALAEGLALAEAMGLDPQQALDVLRASAAWSRIMDSKGAKMLARDYQPVARLSQHLKDVRLMLRSGEASGQQLPLTSTHREILEQAELLGLGAVDNSAIIEVLRRRNS